MRDKDKIITVLKKAFHYLISNMICFRKNTIIIAGLGRSGTTLLYNSIIQNHYYKKQDSLIKFKEQNEFKKGYIYKTHDYPPIKDLPSHVKIIFMHGNIYNIVISTHRKINEWSKKHHSHLNSKNYESNNQIYYKDTLQLEKQFDYWKAAGFMNVAYEQLYSQETQNRLSSYLGFKLKMIKQKKRKSYYSNHPFLDAIKQTYRSLHDKMLKYK